MDINLYHNSIEEDSSKGRNSKRDIHLVKDCHLPFYEDHLGAEGLKSVSLPAGMRYMCQVVHHILLIDA